MAHKKSYLNQILQLSIAIIIFVSAFTLFPVSFLYFFILRFAVKKLAELFRKDLKHLMPMAGTLFAAGEDVTIKSRINTFWYLIFDGHIDLEDFRKAFQERVIQKQKPNGDLMYPELKMYWTTFLNYIFWKEEENFDLEDHVRLYDYNEDFNCGESESEKERAELRLPCPGQGFCDESDLRRILGPLLRKAYAKNKSPWEILLIQNFKSSSNANTDSKSDGSTVLLFRGHHGMLDAYSTIKLFARDLMQEKVEMNINFRDKEGWEKIWFNAVLPLKMSWDLAQAVLSSFDGGNCWNIWGKKEKLTGRVCTSISKSIDAKFIKGIKNKYGVGYNDVLCAVVASVCKRMMVEAGQKVPEQMSCGIPYPMKRHPDGLVNHMSVHMFKWPMRNFSSNKERLLAFSKQFTPSNYFTAPQGFALFYKYCNYLPISLIKILQKFPLTIGFTSLPFASGPLEFKGFGVKLVDVMASVGPGVETVGTIICMISYNGRQRMIAIVDKIYFPFGDLFARFGEYAEEEMKELLVGKKL